MGKDVLTAARVIAERHMQWLKVEDIQEAMVSAMLEYAKLRESKQSMPTQTGDEQNDRSQNVSNCFFFIEAYKWLESLPHDYEDREMQIEIFEVNSEWLKTEQAINYYIKNYC